MRLNFSADIAHIINLIQAELSPDQAVYVVGGALRDVLLGRDLNDLDFALPVDPTHLAKRLAKKLQVGFFVLDDARHTARVVYTRNGNETFPLDFVQFTGDSLLADLKHRDFTINALAVSIKDLETIIDPLGGISDLADGLLRTCSEDSLLDDPVRVLRGIRLAMQFDLSYAPGVATLMKKASPNLPSTSYERQRDEFIKILAGPDPANGMYHCRQFGIFETLIPPLATQVEVPACPPHTLPLFEHTLAAIDYLNRLFSGLDANGDVGDEANWWIPYFLSDFEQFSEQISAYLVEEITPGRSKKGLIMLGALLHDIGKPSTMTYGEDGCLHFYNHAKVGGEMAWQTAKRLTLSNTESTWITTLVCHHMDLLPLINAGREPTRLEVYRFFKQVGGVGVAIALLSLADTLGTYNEALSREKWENALQVSKVMLSSWWNHHDSVINPTLFLDGNDLQSRFDLKPGKKIGDLLEALKQAQAVGDVKNKADAEAFISDQIN